jgi:uncharacterized membrane protein
VTVWLTIAALAVGTAAIKAAGPVALGRREPPPRVANVIALIAPSLLAALVLFETVHAGSHSVVLDSRLAGVAAAAVGLALRLPLVGVIVIAAAASAALRALT